MSNGTQGNPYNKYLPLIKLVFVGIIIASLIVGGLALNGVALTLLLAALLVIARDDRVYAFVAILLGSIIVIVFPQFSLTALDPVIALGCIGVMIFL